jgi:hypothetical protein
MKPHIEDLETMRKQLRWIAMDISRSADAIGRFNVLMLHGSEDDRDTDAFHVAIAALGERVGWAAELALIKMGERSLTFKDDGDDTAAAWMMPPAYHDDGKKEDAS